MPRDFFIRNTPSIKKGNDLDMRRDFPGLHTQGHEQIQSTGISEKLIRKICLSVILGGKDKLCISIAKATGNRNGHIKSLPV
jgi:hypothetical protein